MKSIGVVLRVYRMNKGLPPEALWARRFPEVLVSAPVLVLAFVPVDLGVRQKWKVLSALLRYLKMDSGLPSIMWYRDVVVAFLDP